MIDDADWDACERQFFNLLTRGLSDSEIAAEGGLSLTDVRDLHERLTRKLGRRVQRA